MRGNYIFAFVVLLITLETRAQDFGTTAIYDTLIPLPGAKQKLNRRYIRDTVTNQKHFDYFFNLQVGTLIGRNDFGAGKEVTFTSSTIHGVSIGRKLRTGLGIGFDSYYGWQTLPMFGNVSWDILGTKNTNALFVQLNYGWAKSWQNNSGNDYGLKKTGGGRMTDIQLGYRINYHRVKVSFTVGTKFQRVYSHYEYPTSFYVNGQVVEGPPNTKRIQRDMSRVLSAVTIGWR